MQKQLPNFLIIGAAKSGTTSLYHYLKQHPDVFMPSMKEPSFFAHETNLTFNESNTSSVFSETVKNNTVTTLQDYLALFDGVTTEDAIGEASPVYLYATEAPLIIKKYIPNVKLIVILRNPVQRAFSNYTHFVRSGEEKAENFKSALKYECSRIDKNWHWFWYYIQAGFYAKQLKRYYDVFDASQIKVVLYEELKENPVSMVQNIFDFLGVDSSFCPANIHTTYNVSGTPRSRYLYDLIVRFTTGNSRLKKTLKKLIHEDYRKRALAIIMDKNNQKSESLPFAVREELSRVYRNDILQLQDMISRDLSQWYS